MREDRAHSAWDDGDPAETVQTGEDRDRTAEDRDRRADAHDQASQTRDEQAGVRDERAEARERDGDGPDTGAAADRAGALRDRRGGAADRTYAADDRKAASSDRFLSARDRAVSSIDGLTRAHRRDAGFVELKREIARAKRSKQSLTLAFVDLDDLKGTNDSRGHAAGDQLLREAADSIRSHLRPYDLIIRFGGDEFLCALLGVTMAEAANRFSLVNADLRTTRQASVSVGLAELEADDALEDLVARADQALYSERQSPRSGGA
jgi:diguanylate cyclase (GGDEF)-like protein